MEDQDIKVEQIPAEQKPKKKQFDFISILLTIGYIKLFGPLPALVGFAVTEVVKRSLEKKNPGKKANTVIGWVVGAVVALALGLVLAMALSSL